MRPDAEERGADDAAAAGADPAAEPDPAGGADPVGGAPPTAEADPTVPEAEQLRRVLSELDDARDRARSLAGELTSRQLRWRPEPDTWSVAECLEHLVRTGDAYLPEIDAALARAREEELRAEGPFSRGFLGRWLVRGMEPPPSMTVPAPAPFRPSSEADVSEEAGDPLDRFLAHQDRLVRRVRAADGLDLEAVHVPAPVLSFLRINLMAAFAYLAAHQRRHFWQARQVIGDAEFPDG